MASRSPQLRLLIMNWKIWYKGGATTEGVSDQDWAEAEADDVVCIAVKLGYNESGIALGETFLGCDWYWMHEGKLYQSLSSSEIPGDWLSHDAPETAVLKRGRWTTDEEMLELTNAMMVWVTE